MDKTFLSKSSYCLCVQCKNILWFNKYKQDNKTVEKNESILKKGKEVGEFAKELFGDYEDISLDNHISERIEKTEKLLQIKPNIITEASFRFDNKFSVRF